MSDNNKFSVDKNSIADSQQQINNYTQSFNTLRKAVDGLSQPFNSLSNDLNSLDRNLSKYADSLAKVNAQHQTFISTGDQVNEKASKASETFSSWIGVLNIFTNAIKGWQVALTGGLAIVVAFLPEIVNFATALFKGKDAIDQAKISLSELNKGLSSTDYSKAIQNVDELRIKVDLAKKGFALKSDVVKEYNKTLGQTVGQVKTLDQVETSLKNNAKDYIQMMLYKASALSAIKESADNQIIAQKEMAKSDEESTSYWDSGMANSSDPFQQKLYKDLAKKNRDNAAKPFQEKAHALQSIAEHFETLASQIEQKNPINRIKKQLEDLQNVTGAGIIGSKTFKQIKELKKQLAALDPSYEKDEPSVITSSNRGKKKSKAEQRKQELDRHIKDAESTLQQTADAFNKKLALENNNYAIEKAALQDQLDKKLITQEQFHNESEQLEEKYHAGIGDIIKRFNAEDLAKAQKQQQDLLNAQQQQETLGTDQQNIKKALLPQQKLEAEKQLITDKYNFEIQQAAEAGKDTLNIRQQYEQDITKLTQQYEQQRKEFALKTAQEVSNQAFSMMQNGIKSQADAKVKSLEASKAAELNNSSLTATQKKAIEDKYQKQEAAIKVKAFKDEQKVSILPIKMVA